MSDRTETPNGQTPNGETPNEETPGVGGTHREWLPPQPGPATRGTVILLPGRGEHAGVYERFGRRLAFDAYAVHALDIAHDEDPADLRDRIARLAASAVAPIVLAGSDTGALHTLALAADGKVDVDGVLLAAIPRPLEREAGVEDSEADAAADAGDTGEGARGADDPGWEEELALRTTCPTHRGKLTDDEAFGRGSLFDPVPDRLAEHLEYDSSAYEGLRNALIVHGAADLLSPPATARALAARFPQAEMLLVAGAPHDVLNDATHRSVAAAVVQWLERLRAGAPYAAVVEHG